MGPHPSHLNPDLRGRVSCPVARPAAVAALGCPTVLRARRPATPPLLQIVHDRTPRFAEAVAADVRIAARQRGRTGPLEGRLRLAVEAVRLVWHTDAFGALVWYRVQASAHRHGIPVLPRLAHRRAMRAAQVCIGERAIVSPGVLLPHGQVVIDGFAEVHEGVRIRPFVTIGLRDNDIKGPRIHRDVKIGTGAKVIGPVTVGEGASIGANAVVLDHVAPGAVVVGAPARPVRTRAAVGDEVGR